MPIVIKNFTWRQTNTKIIIDVPMPRVHVFKADVLITPRLLKANHEAYFFEVILLHEIDSKISMCTKTKDGLVFELEKMDEIQWEILEVNMPKNEKLEFKKKLLDDESQRVQKEKEERISKNAELKRAAVSAQIELDTKLRQKIDNIKKQEEILALGDMNEWKKKVETKKNKTKTTEIDNEIIANLKDMKISNQIVEIDGETIKSVSKPKYVRPVSHYTRKEKIKTVNKPRSTRALQILFTEREFPTPCRESRLQEENEFLTKQAEVRRAVGFDSKDLRPEEKSPQYMLDKGREFMSVHNYLGAISAYSFGIKLSPKFLDLYIARSEANLAMGNFNNCVDDTSAALNLLKPALPINLEQRALCIGRRGRALCKLGFLKHGIAELEVSLKLKNDEQFENILEQAKKDLEIMNKKEMEKNK